MLPFNDRLVNVPREDVAPVWTHSFPISKVPNTLGEHLRKHRFGLGIRQVDAARKLRITSRTLSVWETDRTVPAEPYHQRIAAYLGFNPFVLTGTNSQKATNP